LKRKNIQDSWTAKRPKNSNRREERRGEEIRKEEKRRDEKRW
jgi:hypothetical protein